MKPGIILYGAPATGKDTVTEALSGIDPRYRLFERLKSGPGRTAGYRMTDAHEFDRLEKADLLVWVNARYGARYAIDRPALDRLVAAGLIPVVHAGQPEVIDAVRTAMPTVRWTVVQLQCAVDIAKERIAARNTGDDAERLSAHAATPTVCADLTIDTGLLSPDEAAQRIVSAS
ncbi:AAA family ATPase [Nocardia sp. XZ_19_231]|uniref:AAA family ATPase n=1 Tax=Nocardia sp. XZ_19_231 TaxID=2769252 RepID=UPI00188E8E2A|nr:AAA family ATPase [Nocardia sp. XZ_19_231]